MFETHNNNVGRKEIGGYVAIGGLLLLIGGIVADNYAEMGLGGLLFAGGVYASDLIKRRN